MTTATNKKALGLVAVGLGAALALSACASGDPLGEETTTPAGEAIVIGSQDYYSSEIIAEVYAQALEANGVAVERDFRTGQREVYLGEVEAGDIDLFPEYTGNLLQYYDKETTATTSEEVYAELADALPEGLRVLDQAPATDQDSYNVTEAFSQQYGVTSLADLASVPVPVVLGGNSELETRPYGPAGLLEVYGAEVGFTPIEDSGGAVTVQALLDDQVQMVNVYSADPNIATNGLVTLADPEGLFLASNVVPLVSEKVDDSVAEIINTVSAALTAEDLVAMNAQSVNEQMSADDIAAAWLASKNLF